MSSIDFQVGVLVNHELQVLRVDEVHAWLAGMPLFPSYSTSAFLYFRCEAGVALLLSL
jgi:hypothetical protein